jgi:hypothetical protein
MARKRQEARRLFADTSDLLIRELTGGGWDESIPHWKRTVVGEWEELISEFSKRCPGHAREAYAEALRRSHWDFR